MAGLDPAIHAASLRRHCRTDSSGNAWIFGSSPKMTCFRMHQGTNKNFTGQLWDGSNYGGAFFSKAHPDRWAEFDRLEDPRIKCLDNTGAFFDAKPYPAETHAAHTPLMAEIRRDGVDL